MTRWLAILLAVPLWGGASWLVLQLQHLPDDSVQSVCGPWGCGPPTTVLLACHGFWFVLVAPPTVLAARRLSTRRLLLVGAVLALLGIGAMAGVAAWEAGTWLGSEWHRRYFVRRWLFVVVNAVDWPMIELAVAGSTLLATAAVRRLVGRKVAAVPMPEVPAPILGK